MSNIVECKFKNVEEFLERTYKLEGVPGFEFQMTRPRVLCVDGYSVSIQAGKYLYCISDRGLRENAKCFESVELGFPSVEDDLINDLAEDPECPTDTVYGYVPVNLVNKLMEKHGGIWGVDFGNSDMIWDEVVCNDSKNL